MHADQANVVRAITELLTFAFTMFYLVSFTMGDSIRCHVFVCLCVLYTTNIRFVLYSTNIRSYCVYLFLFVLIRRFWRG